MTDDVIKIANCLAKLLRSSTEGLEPHEVEGISHIMQDLADRLERMRAEIEDDCECD
jgi:hypothetical protein